MINAKEYKFEDIKIGQKEKFQATITKSLINEFAQISGDFNPLHMDEQYANLTPFKQRICHGMLLTSFFSQLVGMYLLGKKGLYFLQSLKFISPCFINDTITIEGEVVDKSNSTKIITLKTTINNSGKCLVDGLAKVVLRE